MQCVYICFSYLNKKFYFTKLQLPLYWNVINTSKYFYSCCIYATMKLQPWILAHENFAKRADWFLPTIRRELGLSCKKQSLWDLFFHQRLQRLILEFSFRRDLETFLRERNSKLQRKDHTKLSTQKMSRLMHEIHVFELRDWKSSPV